ncbi:MAG: glycosyltransferase family 2 protein [Actinomycetia bacterium]|nr:glycosyltransferase family 2 protein [Actinomycetes bacterium]
MYNEEENVISTIEKIAGALQVYPEWELLIIDDGSSDNTKELAEKEAEKNSSVKVISYSPNQGRGKAPRVGFKNAAGDIIVTTDADLSYSPEHIIKMVEALQKDSSLDIVIGSPYKKGGKVKNVPLFRLLLSKYGNKFLSFIMPGKLSTFTGILRAYRRQVVKTLELEATDKDIHLEIISKAIALGYKIEEIPAVLEARRRGKSKFKLTSTVISHIFFSLFEKPAFYISIVGLLFIILGMVGGVYIIYLWLNSSLNPERPLMTLIMLFIISGIQIIAFSIIATQLVLLRNEIYRIQRENLEIKSRLDND